MGESRTELIAWINDYTKVEQCGSGAAACGIVDSIYQDLPLQKVKFNAKHEYEFVANFKVLQEAFKRHKIDKPVPVDKLIKCKMMENLEFLQWMKKYWDLNFPGGDYDALARRRGAAAEPIHAPAPVRSAAASSIGSKPPVKRSVGASAARPAATHGRAAGGTGSAGDNAAIARLTAEMQEMNLSIDGLEKEREFYLGKLREIEIFVSARLEAVPPPPKEEADTLLGIQEVLYATTEGFEVPQEGDGEEAPLAEEDVF